MFKIYCYYLQYNYVNKKRSVIEKDLQVNVLKSIHVKQFEQVAQKRKQRKCEN